MDISLNEFESATRKAFRGAGYHWGEAEEAAKAMTWLAARQLQVLPQVLLLLQQADKTGVQAMRPVKAGDDWHGAASALCPVCCGTSLADFSHSLREGSVQTLRDVVSPVLLLPFAARASLSYGSGVAVQWPGLAATADHGTLSFNRQPKLDLGRSDVEWCVREKTKPTEGTKEPLVSVARVDQKDWAMLNDYAARTYVPASAHSRQAGAGSSRSDND